MKEYITGARCRMMEGDSGPTWKRTREGKRECSRIDFESSKGNSEWLLIRTTKQLSDHWVVHGK